MQVYFFFDPFACQHYNSYARWDYPSRYKVIQSSVLVTFPSLLRSSSLMNGTKVFPIGREKLLDVWLVTEANDYHEIDIKALEAREFLESKHFWFTAAEFKVKLSHLIQNGIAPSYKTLILIVAVRGHVADPDILYPWRRDNRWCCGTGLILSGRRVLTTAHSVDHHIRLEVMNDYNANLYTATMLAIAPECDLYAFGLELKLSMVAGICPNDASRCVYGADDFNSTAFIGNLLLFFQSVPNPLRSMMAYMIAYRKLVKFVGYSSATTLKMMLGNATGEIKCANQSSFAFAIKM
ncbi:hypothetical protein RHGRI_035979 [Rhododendron griersonianum]|uniref:Peptidase S1 domain-containing protein n=1 Tax=Rhododendron griersonianum TaxID=479676 RepID=A0AAV6HLP3_9ERIC|nr:hypothetical protein RHGRI_035979 [Rhododendron griersonianum]